jgi:pimeloyl-ACP methyl ester carboxylesterase
VDDLSERLARTRWPEPEPVGDWSQGVPLRRLRELCRYWADGYDWRATERRLNAIPQFRADVDGLAIHFLHVRSADPAATPVILTHGWPGSFLEFERALALLAADGGFHVVVPSLPGYAFSGKPTATGWGIHRIARAWCELMARLGYDRFVAAGSDWGTSISTSIALQHPERLLGLHLVPPLVAPDSDDPTEAERDALRDLDERSRYGSGYSAMHGTRPQTVGYALLDSPAGLAAWIGEKLWTWTDPAGGLTDDRVLGPAVLGEHRRGRRLVHHRRRRHDRRPDRRRRLPGRGAAAVPPLGRATVHRHRALGRTRPRRPLRRLGAARAVRRRPARDRPGAAPAAAQPVLVTEAAKIWPIEASSRAVNCSSVWSAVSPSSNAREKLAIIAGSLASRSHATSRL